MILLVIFQIFFQIVRNISTIIGAYIEDKLKTKDTSFNLTVHKRVPPIYSQPGWILFGSCEAFGLGIGYNFYEKEKTQQLEEHLADLKKKSKENNLPETVKN